MQISSKGSKRNDSLIRVNGGSSYCDRVIQGSSSRGYNVDLAFQTLYCMTINA